MPSICTNALKISAGAEDLPTILEDIFGRALTEDEKGVEIDPTILVPFPQIYDDFKDWQERYLMYQEDGEKHYHQDYWSIIICALRIARVALYADKVDVTPAVDPRLLCIRAYPVFSSNEMQEAEEIVNEVCSRFEEKPTPDEFDKGIIEHLIIDRDYNGAMALKIAIATNYIIRLGAVDEASLRTTIHGTKYMTPGDLVYQDEGTIIHRFASDWAPPYEWFCALVEKYPEVNFYLRSFRAMDVDKLFIAEAGQVYTFEGNRVKEALELIDNLELG